MLNQLCWNLLHVQNNLLHVFISLAIIIWFGLNKDIPFLCSICSAVNLAVRLCYSSGRSVTSSEEHFYKSSWTLVSSLALQLQDD